jgi:hypothetical protein
MQEILDIKNSIEKAQADLAKAQRRLEELQRPRLSGAEVNRIVSQGYLRRDTAGVQHTPVPHTALYSVSESGLVYEAADEPSYGVRGFELLPIGKRLRQDEIMALACNRASPE